MKKNGIRIRNPGQDLVLSSDAKGLTCIGRAALYGDVVQPRGSATGTMPGRTWGYSTYRIAHNGPVIWALDLPLNTRVGIISSTEVYAGMWEVVCYCGSARDAYQFDTVQSAIAVWAFGFVSTRAAGFRAAIYNASGALAYDLSRPYPLFPLSSGVSDFTANMTIPALSRPVVMGCPTSDPSYDTSGGTNRWRAEFYRGMWERISDTLIREALACKQRWEYAATEPIGVATGFMCPTTYLILEGARLP